MRNIAACFPAYQLSSMDQYLYEREIVDCIRIDNTNALKEIFKNSRPREKFAIYLFDFVNEAEFFNVFRENIDKVGALQVITSKKEVVARYIDFTDAIFLVQPLIDLMVLFWDSKVFHVGNVASAIKSGVRLIDVGELKTRGIDLQSLDLKFNVEDFRLPDNRVINRIMVSGKGSGNNLADKYSGVERPLDKLKRILKRIRKEFFEDQSLKQTLNNIRDEFSVEDLGISNTLVKMQNNYANSPITFMSNKGYLTAEQSKELTALKVKNLLVGSLGEVNYAFDKKWIDEQGYIKILSDYYKVWCMSEAEVFEKEIVFSEFRYEACKEFNTFPVRGVNPEVVYFVIDYDNEKAKDQIRQRFNSYELIYARSESIRKRLDAEEAKQ